MKRYDAKQYNSEVLMPALYKELHQAMYNVSVAVEISAKAATRTYTGVWDSAVDDGLLIWTLNLEEVAGGFRFDAVVEYQRYTDYDLSAFYNGFWPHEWCPEGGADDYTRASAIMLSSLFSEIGRKMGTLDVPCLMPAVDRIVWWGLRHRILARLFPSVVLLVGGCFHGDVLTQVQLDGTPNGMHHIRLPVFGLDGPMGVSAYPGSAMDTKIHYVEYVNFKLVLPPTNPQMVVYYARHPSESREEAGEVACSLTELLLQESPYLALLSNMGLLGLRHG